MLEGKNVNLRVMEKEDVPLRTDWYNNPEFLGEFVWVPQFSRKDREKWYENMPPDTKVFFIEKKDGTKIGSISHFLEGSLLEIGYILTSGERGKGYCTEAVQIMVDYLFLSKETLRIQAKTDPRNVASQRVLEKVGFKKEGTLRKSLFLKGKWADLSVYSILREEWKEPRIIGH